MRKFMLGAMVLGGLALATAAQAEATTAVVTESDVTRQAEDSPPADNWVLYTRAGTLASAAAFVDDADAPLGSGSLQLTTATSSEKVFLSNFDNQGESLSSLDTLSYMTYRTTGSAQQVTSLNITIDYNGVVDGGFSTLVYEPVYNTVDGSVVNDTWQTWDALGDAVWWSTKAIHDQCPGATAACDQTWDYIVSHNPDAVIGAITLNQGSGNAGLTVNVDGLTANDTVYDFERVRDADGDGVEDTAPPTDKDQCKKDGYTTFNNPSFSNQGRCVSYVNGRR